MKKAIALTMTMIVAVLCCITALAVQVDLTLLNRKGIMVKVMELDLDTYSDPMIRMKVRARNDTDEKVWIDFKEATVDGVPVVVSTRSIEAHTETKKDDMLLYSVRGSDEDGGKGSEAIRNGKKMNFTLTITSAETYKPLMTQTGSIDLTLTAIKPVEIKKTTTTSSSSKNTAPAFTPSSTDYKIIKKGSKGKHVKELQQRLTDLGYMNDKVNGTAGLSTIIAGRSFCQQNGLPISSELTPEMQELLYSSRAEYYEEPWVPMIIGPEYRWKNPRYSDLDNGSFWFQLVNRCDRTIIGCEVYYYQTDVWGNRYLGSNGKPLTMRMTEQRTIEPGYCVETSPIVIYPFAWTHDVWVGVHKIVFDDGEIRETPESEITYFKCPVKK